jgi:hypothetical protein
MRKSFSDVFFAESRGTCIIWKGDRICEASEHNAYLTESPVKRLEKTRILLGMMQQWQARMQSSMLHGILCVEWSRTHADFGPGLVEAFFDWITSISVRKQV